MGWEDYHLYSFNVGKAIIEAAPDNRMYVDSMWNNFSPEQETRQANTVRLSDYLNKEKIKFLSFKNTFKKNKSVKNNSAL